MHANKREEIEEVLAGDIGAAIGLKDTRTGDTLCDEDQPIILEAMKFPNPVIDVAIEPKTKADQDKLGHRAAEAGGGGSDVPRPHAMPRPARRSSPAWASCTSRSSSTGCARVQGRGQRRPAAGRLPRDDHARGSTDVEGKFIRQSGGKGQYGHVVINIEPGEAGKGFVFEDKIVGGVGPARVHQAGRKRACARRWRTASWPATRWST